MIKNKVNNPLKTIYKTKRNLYDLTVIIICDILTIEIAICVVTLIMMLQIRSAITIF